MTATPPPARRPRIPAGSIPARGVNASKARLRRHRGWRRVRLVWSWRGWGRFGKAVATLAALITAAGAVVAIYLTNRTLDATQQQIGLTEQGQYTDRFGKAVEQLGSDKVNIRLGGIYALERLAHDSPRDALTITEVLAAYVRDRSACPNPAAATPKPAPPIDVAAVLTVLTRRTLDRAAPWADLHGICLGDHALPLADWANLNLTGADLRYTDMNGAQLSGVVAATAKFVGASLTDSSWHGTSAYGADLTHANLTSAIVRDTDFSHAHLDGATLTALNLPNIQQPTASIASSYANVPTVVGEPPRPGPGTNFANATLVDANLIAANLADASFLEADLTRADFTSANLEGAWFAETPPVVHGTPVVTGTRFANANLTGAHMSSVDLRGADFSGANLTRADLRFADLRGVDLRGTGVTSGQLIGANLDGALW